MGRSLAEFDENAESAMANAQFLGEFPDRDALAILTSGSS